MNPDDLKAFEETEADVASAGRTAGDPLARRVPWLCALVRRLHERVQELEQSGIPGWLSEKDQVVAALNAQNARLAAQLAKLEADKLPSPHEYFRQYERLENPAENDQK